MVKQLPVLDVASNLEMFLNYKKYQLDNFIYLWIMIRAVAMYDTIKVLVIKYQAENPKNQMNFSIQFSSDTIDSLLYLAIKNIHLILIVGFASRFITIRNQKLYTATFCELFYLAQMFLLLLSQKFQLSLPSFYKPLLNLYKEITAF